MGLNMQNMVVLLMLAYCMWGYVDFSGNIVARLAGSAGGPSATGMGSGMANAIGDKALSAVGLDKKSRAQMKDQMKDRLKSMQSADKKMPIDSTNRKDIKPPSDNKPSQSSDDPKKSDSDPQLNKTDANVSDSDSGINPSGIQPEEAPSKGAATESESEKWKPGVKTTEASKHANVSSEGANPESKSSSERPNIGAHRSRPEVSNPESESRSKGFNPESKSPSERPSIGAHRSRPEGPNPESELRSDKSTATKEDGSKNLSNNNLQNTTTNESGTDKPSLESETKETSKDSGSKNSNNEDK